MRVIRANHLGMCFGVRDAIALALKEAASGPLTILGELVHNPTVLSEMEARGIKVALQPEQVRGAKVMVTAHGTSEKALRGVRAPGREVLEATCPLVQVAHRAVRRLVAEGYHPVVVGKRDHVEVRGLTEDLVEYDVILCEADVLALKERPRFGVVAQTTHPVAGLLHLVECLKRRFPQSQVRLIDTICQPTKQRQAAAMALAREADVVVVVGGVNSNNTRELVRTCSHLCRQVHQVQTAADLRPEWFVGARLVGVTAGTSTPDAVIESVQQWLENLARAQEAAMALASLEAA